MMASNDVRAIHIHRFISYVAWMQRSEIRDGIRIKGLPGLHPQGVRRGCKGLKPRQHTLHFVSSRLLWLAYSTNYSQKVPPTHYEAK